MQKAGISYPSSKTKGAGPDSSARYIWALRAAGVVLLAMGWAAVALPHRGETEFLTDTAVFAALGAYGFAAAARGRRTAVELERRIRMGLLVHNMELEDMAVRDALTGLFNRRFFFDRLESEIGTATGFQRPLGVMVIDIDGLRNVNSYHGHRGGDRVLAAVGEFLLRHVRGSDTPARTGGDEFAVILPDTTEEAAANLVDRLSQKLNGADLAGGDGLAVTLQTTFAFSGYPWGGETADEVMRQAEAALQRNKLTRTARDGMPTEDASPGGHPIPAAFLKAAEEEAPGRGDA